jgi:hypothetical protein
MPALVLSPDPAAAVINAVRRSPASTARPIAFWIAMLLALAVVVVSLREVLLPFVAGNTIN